MQRINLFAFVLLAIFLGCVGSTNGQTKKEEAKDVKAEIIKKFNAETRVVDIGDGSGRDYKISKGIKLTKATLTGNTLVLEHEVPAGAKAAFRNVKGLMKVTYDPENKGQPHERPIEDNDTLHNFKFNGKLVITIADIREVKKTVKK